MWFPVILDNSQWFANQSEIVLGWFSVIHKPLWKYFWVDSQQFLMICESIWNCFWVILSDSWTTLKTFLGWFSAILSDLRTILKSIYESVWNSFEVILSEWISELHKPFWNDSGAICKTFLNDSWIIKNPHQPSQIIHEKKEEELIFHSLGFYSDLHWIADSFNFIINHIFLVWGNILI